MDGVGGLDYRRRLVGGGLVVLLRGVGSVFVVFDERKIGRQGDVSEIVAAQNVAIGIAADLVRAVVSARDRNFVKQRGVLFVGVDVVGQVE